MHQDRQLVFVYGTLRRGEENHRLVAGTRMLGNMVTAKIYTMFDLGEYPAVIQYGKSAIVGEVYDISGEILAMLDELEECPDYYQRLHIDTPYGKAWMYVLSRLPDAYDCKIDSGDWVGHRTSRGQHF